MLSPNLNRAHNFFRCFSRTHFPDHGAIFRQQRDELEQIDVAGKRRLMILRRPDAILHMTSKRARTDHAQPFFMIEEAEVLLDLNVTEIVPVTGMG